MYSNTGTPGAAAMPSAILTGLLLGAAVSPLGAETVKTVNGEAIDSTVVDFYVQSRTQQPPNEVQQEQRDQLVSELTDIYLLTSQEIVDEIEQNPAIQAQMELQRRGILAQAYATRFFSGLDVSEEEIRAEYEEQAEMAPPLQFKARHILVESQGEAASLIGELEDGADFAQLAEENSTGPSASGGGDLGWFTPNQMVKPFSDAVAQLEDGAYTKSPVQTDFGWHVILREDSRESEAPTLESVRNKIVQKLQQEKFQAHLEDLRQRATIE